MVDLVCLRSFAHVCEAGTVAAAADRIVRLEAGRMTRVADAVAA